MLGWNQTLSVWCHHAVFVDYTQKCLDINACLCWSLCDLKYEKKNFVIILVYMIQKEYVLCKKESVCISHAT